MKRILFCPGSRIDEATALTPTFHDIATALKSDASLQFSISIPNQNIKNYIDTFHLSEHVTLEESELEDALHNYDICICASGTVSIKILFSKTPMIILAKTSFFTYCIAKYLLRLNITYVGMPNILAKKCIVPEYIQGNINTNTIINQIYELVTSPEQTINELDIIKKTLTVSKNPFFDIAQTIINKLNSR